MSWLSRLLGFVPADERRGLAFDAATWWDVSCPDDLPVFLRSLPLVVPPGSILYVEAVAPPADSRAFLEAHRSRDARPVQMATIWPRPQRFHLDLTQENVDALAAIEENHPSRSGTFHLHVYSEDRLLIEGYDAFAQEFRFSPAVPEQALRQFCQAVGGQFERYGASAQQQQQAGR